MRDPGQPSSIPLLEASDVKGAHDHIAAIYIPHRLVSHGRTPLAFKLAHFETPRITFGHVTYGADTELFCPAMETCYHVNLTLAGTTRVRQGRRLVTTTAGSGGAILDFEEPYCVRWSGDAVQYAIKFSCNAIADQLAALLGHPAPAPHFDLNFDLTDPAGRGLLSAVHHLRSQYAMTSALGAMPQRLLAPLESFVLTQILFTMSHNYSEVLRTEPARVGRAHVRRAIELMEDRPSEPWTLEELAREACVSVRALQVGFQRELDTSPMRYLREVRLRRVREDLLATSEARVSEVATRWGFYHLGRFSQLYRERFGISPSQVRLRATSRD